MSDYEKGIRPDECECALCGNVEPMEFMKEHPQGWLCEECYQAILDEYEASL